MTTFEYALIIRDSLDCETVLNRYGLSFNARGFAHCPFHSEKTASFKIQNNYKWHCFGCGKSGDIIDFVIDYFGIKWRDALSKLNTDFGLNLPIDRRQTVSDVLQAGRKAREIEQERADKTAAYNRQNELYENMLDAFSAFDCATMQLKPKPGETILDPMYVYALQHIELYRHLAINTPYPERG